MSAYVYIFVPVEKKHSEVDAALRQHLDSPEFIPIPTATATEAVQDAEQMPLWRWFISSK